MISGHYGQPILFGKNVYTVRIFTKKGYIIVQCTVTWASRLVNIFDHCYSRQCSLSMCRSQLSKAANLLLKSVFTSFCHSNFVYDTGNVYFAYRRSCSVLFKIRLFSLFCLMVLVCHSTIFKFTKGSFSTAVGYYER